MKLPMKGTSPSRIFALVTEAFGGQGGIAQYNRDLLSAMGRCDGIDEILVLPRLESEAGVLPDRVRQLAAIRNKLSYSFAALRDAKRFDPHVIFCGHLYMSPLAAVVAGLCRAPLWIQIHGIEAWQELSRLHWAVRNASLITSVSRYSRKQFLQWAVIDPGLIKVLPNTVDPRFRPGPKPDYLLRRYNMHGKKIMFTVSRLAASEQYKGHDRVLRVMPRVLAAHPDTVYLIAGDGDDRQRLEALAIELGLGDKVRFVGPVSWSELPDHYRLADLFIMPSSGEGFGIVFLEAMACGLRAIGGNRDGSVDPLSTSVLGTAIAPDDENALITEITGALSRAQSFLQPDAKFSRPLFEQRVADLVRWLPQAKGLPN